MAMPPALSIVIAIVCSLLYFKIEYVACASYILTENHKAQVDLNEPISESVPDYKYAAGSANCCSNATCIYDMVANALQDSQELNHIRSFLFVNRGQPPDFLPIKIQVLWTKEVNGEAKNQTNNMSYVWGGTTAKAVFGPVQDIFPKPSLYNVFLTIVSLVEEAIVPKELVVPQPEKVNARLQEENETVVLNIRHTCISNSMEMKSDTLNLTIQRVIKEALQQVSW